MSSVFISYIRENRETIDKLCEVLTSYGIDVWVDWRSLEPGDLWEREIRQAIRERAFFIPCFSKEYNDRDETYMEEELNVAIKVLRQKPLSKKWCIPVKLNKCEIPDYDIGRGETLRSFQYVDLSEDWNTGIQRLLKSISPETSETGKHFRIGHIKAKQDDHEGAISNAQVTNMPEEEPTAIVKFEIDGIPNEQVVFTNAKAALNSEQFSSVLSWMEGYNAEYRGKRIKAGLSADFQNSFHFLTKSAAMDFANLATKDYNDIIRERYSYIDIREEFPWYIVQLYPRYF